MLRLIKPFWNLLDANYWFLDKIVHFEKIIYPLGYDKYEKIYDTTYYVSPEVLES